MTRTRTQPGFYSARTRAISAVSQAKQRGELPYLTGEIACVDCGDEAKVYDHRDYRKPLEVQPVCNQCNFKRGRAVWQ